MKKQLVKLLALGMAMVTVVPGSVPSYADVIDSKQDSTSVKAAVDSRYTITIPKLINLSVDNLTMTGTGSYKVGVQGDIDYNTSVYVVPQSQFELSNSEDTILTTVTQDKTEFAYSEILEETAWGNGSLLASGLSAGDWEGIFYFNIDALESGSSVDAPGDKVINSEFQDSETPINAGTYQMGKGQSASINMSYNGKDVSKETVYSSDNERIAVDANGNVDTTNAVGGDEATITATYTETTTVAGLRTGLFNPLAAAKGVGSETKTLVAQFKIQVIGIAFDKDTVEVAQGDSVTVTANILPDSVGGVVKWKLNGLDFGTEGNIITINVAEDAILGNYTLIASYGGTTETLNIKVKEPVSGPSVSGIVNGGEYEGSVTVTVGEGNTVTVNDENQVLDENSSFTLSKEGTYTIIIVGTDGTSLTITITVKADHVHTFINGVCANCKQTIAGVYNSDTKELMYTYSELEDAGFNISKDYSYSWISTSDQISSNLNCAGILKNLLKGKADKVILVLPDNINKIGSKAFYTGNSYNANYDIVSSIILPDIEDTFTIGYAAFYNTSIHDIWLPKNTLLTLHQWEGSSPSTGVVCREVTSFSKCGPSRNNDITIYYEESQEYINNKELSGTTDAQFKYPTNNSPSKIVTGKTFKDFDGTHTVVYSTSRDSYFNK